VHVLSQLLRKHCLGPRRIQRGQWRLPRSSSGWVWTASLHLLHSLTNRYTVWCFSLLAPLVMALWATEPQKESVLWQLKLQCSTKGRPGRRYEGSWDLAIAPCFAQIRSIPPSWTMTSRNYDRVAANFLHHLEILACASLKHTVIAAQLPESRCTVGQILCPGPPSGKRFVSSGSHKSRQQTL